MTNENRFVDHLLITGVGLVAYSQGGLFGIGVSFTVIALIFAATEAFSGER